MNGSLVLAPIRDGHSSYCKMINNNNNMRYIFCPLATETLGPICVKGVQFLSKLGSRLSATSGDKRKTSFLFQRISIAIQRCNAICILGTFPAIPVTDGMTCWMTLHMPCYIVIAYIFCLYCSQELYYYLKNNFHIISKMKIIIIIIMNFHTLCLTLGIIR